MSVGELANRSGVSLDYIERLMDAGLLPEREENGERGFGSSDIQRVRLIETFERAGLSVDGLAAAVASGSLSLAFLDMLFPEPAATSGMTFAELAKAIGVPLELVERLQIGFGLPRPGPDELVREDDVAVYPLLPQILSAGLSERHVIRGVRVYGENIRRITQFQVDLLHSQFEEQFRRDGMSEGDLLAMVAKTSNDVRPVAEKLILWLYRRHREHYTTKHLIDHAESLLQQAGLLERDQRTDVAIAFLDLSGFTRLTEERGDEVAADLAANLAVLVQETAADHRGRPVKWLGDGVMFHFRDPANAVLCGLDLVEQAPAAGLPRAHVGVNAGPVVFRDSDYFGRTVNIASRIANFARPGEVLVGERVAAVPDNRLRFSEIGPILLPGLIDPVPVFSAARAD
jgi:adenylate cyclase